MRSNKLILVFVVILAFLVACGSTSETGKQTDKSKVATATPKLIEPTIKPTTQATTEPTTEPSIEPTIEPTIKPTIEEEGYGVDRSYVDAYLQVMDDFSKEDTEYRFDLIDFNGDDIPELVAGIEGYTVSMFSYVNERFVVVIEDWAYGVGGNSGYDYLPGKNVLRNYNSDFAGLTVYLDYMNMDKEGNMKMMYDESLITELWKDKNNNEMPDEGEELSDPIYYQGKKEITEKEYNDLLVDGEFEYMTGSKSVEEVTKLLQ